MKNHFLGVAACAAMAAAMMTLGGATKDSGGGKTGERDFYRMDAAELAKLAESGDVAAQHAHAYRSKWHVIIINHWQLPCPAGKTSGVIGPNGLYRTCLHSLPKELT